jgi:hypothetical protein
MRLTDEHILETIKALQARGEKRITQPRIAEIAGCHIDTVRLSTRRLQNAKRLIVTGTQGSKPLDYKVVENA